MMNNEMQIFFDVAVGVIGVMGGWILNTVWAAVKDLQEADKELAEKVGQIEVLVAGRYITREEFNNVLNQVFTKLDTIRDIVSQKADR
jgi:ribosomal protein S11